jgi:hypothetical protein
MNDEGEIVHADGNGAMGQSLYLLSRPMASMKRFGEWAYRAAKLPGMPIRRKKSM